MTDEELPVVATLLVMQRGVPIGRTSLVQLPPPDRAPLPADIQAVLPPPPALGVHGFEPLPGYESVRSVVCRASEAAAKLGYLGPVDDPESDRRGREAKHAFESLLKELEFRDETGHLVSVDVIAFDESQFRGEPYIALGGTIDEATASVLARLRSPHLDDSDHQPPAA